MFYQTKLFPEHSATLMRNSDTLWTDAVLHTKSRVT